MLQHVIDVKAKIFKDVSKRNELNTVLLKESVVSYDKLAQLTLFCKQQAIPEDYFEPASHLFMDYWGRFFPKFDLHEVYYEFSEAGDFALTIYFRRNSRKVKGETRDLKDKGPELLGFCLREVDIHKMKQKDQELTERKARIKKLETEYDLFKEFAEQDIQKKNNHLDELQDKYEKIELEKKELCEATTVQEITIDELQDELTQLQTELSSVKEQLYKRKSVQKAAEKSLQEKQAKERQEKEGQKQKEQEEQAKILPATRMQSTDKALQPAAKPTPVRHVSAVKQSVSPPKSPPKYLYRATFDPEVSEKKEEFQRQIKERFRQSQRPGGRDKVKISEEAYETFVTHIDFLDFKWRQAIGMPDSRKELDFYEWCQKFIDHLPNFKDDLHLKVKRTVLRQDTYTTTRETLHKLQGYALLNQYLELTAEKSNVNDETPPFLHN